MTDEIPWVTHEEILDAAYRMQAWSDRTRNGLDIDDDGWETLARIALVERDAPWGNCTMNCPCGGGHG